MRIQLSPAGIAAASFSPVAASKAGRPPSPATLQLRHAMEADAANKGPRPRTAYLRILADAGGPQSSNAAVIVSREAKRAFGNTLGRNAAKKETRRSKGRKAGRQASPATAILRAKLKADATKGELRDASHYLRWLMDQPGINAGLKQARPVVYRELRAAR